MTGHGHADGRYALAVFGAGTYTLDAKLENVSPQWTYLNLPPLENAPDQTREVVLREGEVFYLSKPFRPAELELMLIRLAERQASQSLQDAASGLYHRAGFTALARQQLKAARRTKTEMILLRADVNGESLDHTERSIGDLGRVVQRTFRDADVAGRVDGTDCGVLLVNAGTDHTDIALSRLQQNLEAHNARAAERQQLKVRVGQAHFDPGRPCSFEELVAQADADVIGRGGDLPDGASQL